MASDSGDAVHQVFATKSDLPRIPASVKATLPAERAPIVGLVQARHTPAPLYLVTRDTLYATSAARDGTMETLSSLSALSLSPATKLVAAASDDGTADALYLLDTFDTTSGILHTITVADGAMASPSLTMAPLPSQRAVLDVQAILPPTGKSYLLVLLDEEEGAPLQLVMLDPTATPLAYTPLEGTLPFASADFRFGSLGLPLQYGVAAGSTWYSIFLPCSDEPPVADVNEVGPFEDPAMLAPLGGMQYFV